MSSSNGNIFRITGPLYGEFTGWILLAKASDAELCYFFLFAPGMNGWVNNRDAGDWRRHRTHYDTTVMSFEAFDIARLAVPQYSQHIYDLITKRKKCLFLSR